MLDVVGSDGRCRQHGITIQFTPVFVIGADGIDMCAWPQPAPADHRLFRGRRRNNNLAVAYGLLGIAYRFRLDLECRCDIGAEFFAVGRRRTVNLDALDRPHRTDRLDLGARLPPATQDAQRLRFRVRHRLGRNPAGSAGAQRTHRKHLHNGAQLAALFLV